MHDSLHEYRITLLMPRMLNIIEINQMYYKATEVCIKATLHLAQHVPAVAAWLKPRVGEVQWWETWLSRNRQMPELSKDGSAPEGAHIALFVVKHNKTDGVHKRWEAAWDAQIGEYGIGLGMREGMNDYAKICKKTLMDVRVKK